MNPSTSMRAQLVAQPGGPLQPVRLPRPQAAAGEVLVRVHASGVNPLDLKIRAGQGAHARQPLPAVLGMDLAGVVEAIGAGVTTFAPGDEVYGMASGIGGRQGSLAEYVAVDARLLARKPASLSMREAAALPLIAITAWEGLVDRARVGVGHNVLVHGGAGGVGHIVVQLARAFGAEVFATGSAAQRESIEALGASPIDYRDETVEQYVQRLTEGEGFDIVYDTVGGATLDAAFAAARYYSGHVVSCLGWGEHKLAPLSFRGASYSGVFTLLPLLSGRNAAHHGEILAAIAQRVDAGELRVRLDEQRFSLDDAEAAHQRVLRGEARGKVVVDI
ncbi:zinc-dependent alcohol dehydrogenase family protein [Pseudomonas knackmussii]|uniref:zinc-dependent alcohol dehydrogenase family protein n=1 Tax=Pseudomonas knackmussii TaxID=65741 RepID=UPI003F4A8324